jgi:L-ascorbate metabolism protein UlaG (beta-lactamase superfamily)
MKEKIILGSGAILVLIVILVQYPGNQVSQPTNVGGDLEDGVNVTLLTNAGVMIEAKGMRIYIDPVELPSEYGDSPADLVLITHNHGDHYQESTVNMLQKEGTVNVFPEMMRTEITRHDGVGVDPLDELELGSIKVTAFYMYTFSPVPGQPAGHPAESNFTSYIVDVDGFTIFHAGDSKNLQEYEELKGEIDVAMLPLGPGCQTMADTEVVDVLRVIEPAYFIPIHFTEGNNDAFVSRYGRSIEATTECEVCNLDHFSTHAFETE